MTFLRQLRYSCSPLAQFFNLRFQHRERVRATWALLLTANPLFVPHEALGIDGYEWSEIGKAAELLVALSLSPVPPYPPAIEALPEPRASRLLHAYRDGLEAPETRPSPTNELALRELLDELFLVARWEHISHGLRQAGWETARIRDLLGQFAPTRLPNGRYEDLVREDLRHLWLIHEREGKRRLKALGHPIELSPVLVPRWAEADLVVGRTLVEVKTSGKPLEAFDHWLNQVLGYALLDSDDRYGLEAVGIHLARSGMLATWPLRDLLAELTGEARISPVAARAELRSVLVANALLPSREGV